MKNFSFSLIVFFASCFYMHAQNTQFKIISNQNNSIVVDFILTDYAIDDYKVLDGDMHQKIKALDAVAILKKGHPEVLKFTTNLQMPNKGISSVNIISTSIDNLLKGSAGQAIQNMNIMFGLDEGEGLTNFGLYP